MISLTEQIECVERELGLRKRVYPRRVGDGKMTQSLADKEIARMEAVLATLREKEGGELLPFGAPLPAGG